MNGKFERTSPKDQQCEHCGLWFSDRGVKAHESHCFLEGREYRIIPPEDAEEGMGEPPNADGVPPDDTGPPQPEGAGVTQDPEPQPPEEYDGEGDVDVDDQDGAELEDVATDGGGLGLEGPPETSSSSSASTSSRDPTGPTVDDLPDRYVSVEEYLEAVREETHGVDVDELAEHLEEYDVVDVEETTEEKIAAYPIEEVAG